MNSIFYNGEEFTRTQEVDTTNLAKFIKTEGIEKIVGNFFNRNGEEYALWNCPAQSPIFLTKTRKNCELLKVNLVHKNFTESFGEIVEIFSSKLFENIHVIFACQNESEKILDFVDNDYCKKCAKQGLTPSISARDLSYLGQESDGQIYLYDEYGKIFLYAQDHLINQSDLIIMPDQPEDTFYLKSGVSDLNSILKLIFK